MGTSSNNNKNNFIVSTTTSNNTIPNPLHPTINMNHPYLKYNSSTSIGTSIVQQWPQTSTIYNPYIPASIMPYPLQGNIGVGLNTVFTKQEYDVKNIIEEFRKKYFPNIKSKKAHDFINKVDKEDRKINNNPNNDYYFEKPKEKIKNEYVIVKNKKSLDKFQELILNLSMDNNCYIAGGFANYINSEDVDKTYNDIDIFSTNNESFYSMYTELIILINKYYRLKTEKEYIIKRDFNKFHKNPEDKPKIKNPLSMGFDSKKFVQINDHSVIFSINNYIINLIPPLFSTFRTKENILDSFDFTVNQTLILDKQYSMCSIYFIEDESNKNLRLHRNDYDPIRCMRRMNHMLRKGYNIELKEQIKIIESWNRIDPKLREDINNNINDIDELEYNLISKVTKNIINSDNNNEDYEEITEEEIGQLNYTKSELINKIFIITESLNEMTSYHTLFSYIFNKLNSQKTNIFNFLDKIQKRHKISYDHKAILDMDNGHYNFFNTYNTKEVVYNYINRLIHFNNPNNIKSSKSNNTDLTENDPSRF